MYVDYSYAAPFPNTEKKEVPQYSMEKTQIILIQMTFLYVLKEIALNCKHEQHIVLFHVFF